MKYIEAIWLSFQLVLMAGLLNALGILPLDTIARYDTPFSLSVMLQITASAVFFVDLVVVAIYWDTLKKRIITKLKKESTQC